MAVKRTALKEPNADPQLRSTASNTRDREASDPDLEATSVPEPKNDSSPELSQEVRMKLRTLSHDLSNSLETILQAAYLLGQTRLDTHNRKWVDLIDTASKDAARLNREIREILKSQS